MELSKQEFNQLSNHIHAICGIAIAENKAYLIKQRLESLIRSVGCSSFGAFYYKLKQNAFPQIDEKIINAITTNETSFFRDGHPFVTFKEFILPQLAELICRRKSHQTIRKGAKVRLWSAGSSTGQEPYSLAMLIHEFTGENQRLFISDEDFGILATDISTEMLARAMTGQFSELEIKRGLSPRQTDQYFIRKDKVRVIKSDVRLLVEFRQVNLVKPFSMLGGFDVILCRNVLIYFNTETKIRIIDQFHNMLSEGGFLILGATENIFTISDRFESIHYGDTLLYRKKD
jgi:chemotaxis protein methyltransferase CheR